MPNDLSEIRRKAGHKGGLARGACKRRGDKSYYARIAAISWARRRAKK